MMNLGWSLLVWALVFLIVLLVSRKAYLTWWNAFILATLFGFLFLLIFMPFGSVYDKSNPWVVIYLIIMVLSPLVLAIYVIRSAIHTKSTSNSLMKFREPAGSQGSAKTTMDDLFQRAKSLSQTANEL